MPEPGTLLGGLTSERFLAEYWQKRPLLVRGAMAAELPRVSPEELAGLACEDHVESRLIERPADGRAPSLRHGPFKPEDFSSLPATHWTLLVQQADRLLDPFADFLGRFDFVPNWRVDDVMISYAATGGGVGPHIDNYDVFLVQGAGRRRWRIGLNPVAEESAAPDDPLRTLTDFRADAEWILEPGDMLYLPPRLAHEGEAIEPCMTYSVGFRAPSYREIVFGMLGSVPAYPEPEPRYTDPDLQTQAHPGEITPSALKQVAEILRRTLLDPERTAETFGRLMTDPGDDEPERLERCDGIFEQLEGGLGLRRSSPRHFAFVERRDGGRTLFVGGSVYHLSTDLAEAVPILTGSARITFDTIRPFLSKARFRDVFDELVTRGFLLPEED